MSWKSNERVAVMAKEKADKDDVTVKKLSFWVQVYWFTAEIGERNFGNPFVRISRFAIALSCHVDLSSTGRYR